MYRGPGVFGNSVGLFSRQTYAGLCGLTSRLVEFLSVPTDVIFFITDSVIKHNKTSGLSEFLTVVTCVLLLPSGGMSAPTGVPIWVDPCGRGAEQPPFGSTEPLPETNPISDHALLSQIRITARNAYKFAAAFSHDYVSETFKVNFDSHHEKWKTVTYDWLPPMKNEVQKILGKKTPQHHLSKLAEKRLTQALLANYEYLQTIAVGLEQIHLDKSRFNEPFAEEFKQMQYKLRMVLCEVQTAILERDSSISIEDIQRDVMPEPIRADKSSSSRHLRDWIIFRDLMNCLEYLIEVCEFFDSP